MKGSRTALAIAAAVALVGAAPAWAADDGYQNVFSSLFGAVGLIKPDPPPEIDYRERAPLVLPPQPGLPSPAKATARSAAWPQDPDVIAHKKALEDARAPWSSPVRRDGDVVSADELAKGRGNSEPVRPNECGNNGNARNCLVLNPDELKRQGEAFEAANPDAGNTVTAGQEPERAYLTQPPTGYLKATKTMKATAEAPIEKVDEASPRYFLKNTHKEDE